MPATGTKPAETVPDDYLALIRLRPLRPIRDDADYGAAVEVLYALDTRTEQHGTSQGERDYADTLATLLTAYDEKQGHFDLTPTRAASLGERLEEMMNDYDVGLDRLAEVAGIGRGEMDEVMAGRAVLSVEPAKRLAAEYGCDEDFLL